MPRVGERAGLVPAGVVDQDVDPAELLYGPVDHRLDALAIGDVRAYREGARARRRRLLGVRLVQVGDDDGRPFRRELPRDRLADALPGTGHDRDLVIELSHRGVPL